MTHDARHMAKTFVLTGGRRVSVMAVEERGGFRPKARGTAGILNGSYGAHAVPDRWIRVPRRGRTGGGMCAIQLALGFAMPYRHALTHLASGCWVKTEVSGGSPEMVVVSLTVLRAITRCSCVFGDGKRMSDHCLSKYCLVFIVSPPPMIVRMPVVLRQFTNADFTSSGGSKRNLFLKSNLRRPYFGTTCVFEYAPYCTFVAAAWGGVCLLEWQGRRFSIRWCSALYRADTRTLERACLKSHCIVLQKEQILSFCWPISLEVEHMHEPERNDEMTRNGGNPGRGRTCY